MSATMQWTHMDRSEWERGPWDAEPDKIQWVDEATGFDCLIVRNRLGALCGYVGVPAGHPCHGAEHDNVRAGDEWPDVHGGLTYSGACQEGADEAKAICHIPQPGRPDDVWWLGFDCAHSMDIAPGLDEITRRLREPPLRFGGEQYRTVSYVRAECAALARQLVNAVVVPDEDDDED